MEIDRKNIIDFYSTYSKQFSQTIANSKAYNQSYIDFVAHAKYKNTLLDLACGPGNVSAYIRTLLPRIRISCVDLSDAMLSLAQQNVPDASCYKSDILNITIPQSTFDLIICAFGLPYIHSNELQQFVQEVTKFSHVGTSVYVSCMEGNTMQQEQMSFANNNLLQVQRHSKQSIIDSFTTEGFLLTDYRNQPYTEPDNRITNDMIFFFEKQ